MTSPSAVFTPAAPAGATVPASSGSSGSGSGSGSGSVSCRWRWWIILDSASNGLWLHIIYLSYVGRIPKNAVRCLVYPLITLGR
jgi:hypothetical protein